MRKIFIALMLYFISTQSYAFSHGLAQLITATMRIEGLQTNILNNEQQQLDVNHNILSTQRTIESLISSVNSNTSGNSGWGWFRFKDYQNYGDAAHDWSGVVSMASVGHGGGELGQVIGEVGNQFPMNKNVFNRGVFDKRTQNYYALKSQTVLAVRAASQLDYNKIQAQIDYQHMLQYQIEQSHSLKAALDLNNRLQVENNLIQLEILRQIVLTNQQQAVSEQASLNAALSHAEFLTHE
jgi:hypothetical protein